MPLYSYECEMCGTFRSWAAMSESQKCTACPNCSSQSARMVTAPFIARLDAASRIAHARNEKSSHEPQVMSRKQVEKSGRPRHAHSHANHAHAGASRLEKDYRVHTAPDRPWLLGH